MPFPFANIFTQQAPAAAPAPIADPAAPASAQPAPGTPPGTPPATPGTAQLQQVVPQVEPVQTPNTAPNGVVPNNVNEADTPLAKFADFWDNDPNAAAPAGEFTPETLDPAKLQEVMGGVNLTGAITPEMQARINAGGEDAMAAMMEVVNTTGQQAMVHSATVANKMVTSQVAKAIEAMEAKIPGLVKSQSVNSALHEQNPIFSNPAVAPIMEATKQNLQVKFPNATAPELTKMAQDYVLAIGQAFNPATPAASPDQNNFDWSGYENLQN